MQNKSNAPGHRPPTADEQHVLEHLTVRPIEPHEAGRFISSLTLAQLDAQGWLRLKRNCWVIESRLHHALDVSLDEDRSRVRQRNAALVLGLFRRLVVSVAQTAIAEVQTRQTRWTLRRYQQGFARSDGGSQRLAALIFAKAPSSGRLPK